MQIDAQKRETFLVILLLFAAAAVCYNAVSGAAFVWDDEYIVLRNPLLRAPLWSLQIFKQDIINSGFNYTVYYRPLQILSYAVDYRLWGMKASAFHLSSVFLHFLNGVIVFFFTCRITKDRVAAFLTGLLFVIHPAHSCAVSYISSRTDLLFFLFGFLSMSSFALFAEKKRYVFLSGSAFFLAFSLLSKEAAVVFPFLILFLDAVLLRRVRRFRFIHHVPNFFVTGGYVALHWFLLRRMRFTFFETCGAGKDLLRFFEMIREFVVLSIFPVDMHMRRDIGVTAAGTLLFLLILIFFACSLVFLKKIRRILVFSLGFFIIALTPFLFASGYFRVFGEHWMYLASYGIFLFTAAALVTFYRRSGVFVKGALVFVIFLGIVFYSSSTIGQNVYWREDVALSDRVLAFSRKDMPAMHYKAVQYLEKGKGEESLEIMDSYVKANPDSPRAWYIKGRLTLAADRTDEAERDFEKALSIDPDYDNGYLGLAFVAFIKDEGKKGVECLERVIAINPGHSEAMLLLGTAYFDAGKKEKALEITKEARRINPYDYNSLVNLGTMYTRHGYLREGALCYLEAVRLYPERPMAYYNLGQVFLTGGQGQEAERWLRKALAVDPSYAPAIELLWKMRSERVVDRGS
ncbi:MAG: tetratricopeptide repeat protein [Candidatus Omnitrophota bacterium]|nr:tetratricopeptide repeat protein [Candidatus Omnitrophota bacterium]